MAPVLGAGCGNGGGSPGLDDFLPEVPAPTGEPQNVWAGEITADRAEELIDGPATSGMVGDFFMRNSRARFVIQAPTRVIGVVPQGGNLVDAVALDGEGADVVGDHFGELSLVYLLGRTCRHDTLEVLHDGSGGGAAVLRARGFAEPNDFINLRGIGLINVPVKLDPDIEDDVECATTYVLEPDADALGVYWTLFNPQDTAIDGPVGALNDTGGEVEAWAPTRGFERAGIDALTSAGDPAPVDYVVYQGPGVAYGILPKHPDLTTPNSHFLIAGVSILLFNGQTLLDIINRDTFYLDLEAETGKTFAMDIVVGTDAGDVEAYFRGLRDEPVDEVSGAVSWSGGAPAPGARVGFYEDANDDGVLDGDDIIRGYADARSDGTFAARIPPGNYLARAEVKNIARSEAVSMQVPSSGVDLSLPEPVAYDYEIIDDDSGNVIPGKITVFGRHPAFPDARLFETYDRVSGVVDIVHAVRGTTVDIGDGADPQLLLPAGGTYRVVASRGTEWSVAEEVVTPEAGDPVGDLQLRLRHVAPATGYVSSEYHVHQIGSPDSPVNNTDRIASMVSDGVEVFAATDHDYVSDLQPVIEAMGVERYVRAIPGIEVTPFVYGHFNAWPVQPMDTTPNKGAVDWARGVEGYAMIPGEIFGEMRDRGAEIIQVNHPRSASGPDFMQFFDRAGLAFDYESRQITGDMAKAPVPNEWLRLPETTLWDDSFNALEVWNGFDMADSNQDGVREIVRLDIVLRDWFNFLSFGLEITPLGNSDTHTVNKDPSGMPRTYVRVTDDSPAGLESGNVVADVLTTLGGAGGAARDIVVTNGPHIQVTAAGQTDSVLGGVVDGTSGSVTFDIEVVAPDWAAFDTIEVFANATPEVSRTAPTVLQPLACFTSRPVDSLADEDPCALAPHGGARPLVVESASVGGGYERWEASASLTVEPGDLENREGADGSDAWFVVRVRGSRAIFPILMNGVMNDDTIDVLVSGDESEREAALSGRGVPATAFTSPIFVDFDGSGYTAIFRPQ